MPSDGSVSQWIIGAKRGESVAVQRLWERYFDRLVHLARKRLIATHRRVADEEDVALSAFASFCTAAEQGRFPDLSDRDDLWRLLIRITAQKAVDQIRHDSRKKRGGGRVLGESALKDLAGKNGDQRLARMVGDDPSPEFAAIVAEQCRLLLDQLEEDLRAVAEAKMEGYTNQEIADRRTCSLSTVERSLRLIRKRWQQTRNA